VHTTMNHGKNRKAPTLASPLRALRRSTITDGVAEPPMETCFESQELTETLTDSPTPGEEDQNFKENETWGTVNHGKKRKKRRLSGTTISDD
jgi:hypothetical protein